METINLLIVDDEEEYLNLMRDILKPEGYEIYTTQSGQEALKILEKNEIHIVLIDILMPEMLGYNVCEKIREKYSEKPVQIVLVSGLTDDIFLEQAIEVGGDDFIHKPIVPIELQRRIKAAVIRLRGQMKLYNERKHLKETVAKQDNQYKRIKKASEKLKSTNKELKNKVRFDMLSGLLNRMSLFNTIDIEIERTIRTGTPLTGVMLDIDHFKQINDNYGHPVGDIVIQKFGGILKSSMRKCDYAGRYGGEEFFMILTNATLKQGYNIGERFRKSLEENPIESANKTFIVTVSMGIAQYRLGESRETWIERVDKAMYKAKRMGGNRIVLE